MSGSPSKNFAPEGTWSRIFRLVWLQASARISLLFLAIMYLVAAFAPFLAGNHAIFRYDPASAFPHVSMPVLRGLNDLQFNFLVDTLWVLFCCAFFWFKPSFIRPLLVIFLVLDGFGATQDWLLIRPPILDASNDRTFHEAGVFKLLPLIPYSPNESSSAVFSPPDFSLGHYCGTDDTGRDWAARLIHGAPISLSVGLVAQAISLVLGVILGGMAGYYKGWFDILLMRFVEMLDCIPTLLLILVVIGMLKVVNNMFWIMVIIGATSWTGLARLVRAEFLRLSQMPFVHASQALGGSDFRIITRHLIPNALGPILVTATFGVASAIMTEASLSFLGFGIQVPTPAWGSMLSESDEYFDFAWWMPFFPSIVIFLTLLSYNFIGEALRDAVDPRLQINRR